MTGNVDWYWAWPMVSVLFIESWAGRPARVSAGVLTFIESAWLESGSIIVAGGFFEESLGTIGSFAKAVELNKHIAKKQTI
jgi:hypothetical protein